MLDMLMCRTVRSFESGERSANGWNRPADGELSPNAQSIYDAMNASLDTASEIARTSGLDGWDLIDAVRELRSVLERDEIGRSVRLHSPGIAIWVQAPK
jgi:hypothetical protein